MLIEQLNSVIFVGEFPPGCLDERDLFGGNVDFNTLHKLPQITQCSFASGKYQLLLTPDRIDLRANETTILSNELVEAARTVARRLDGLQQMTKVTAVGMNCDGAIVRNDIGKDGEKYCTELVSADIQHLIGAPEYLTKISVSFPSPPFFYNIRLEPHAKSQGDHLFVAVNGHQTLTNLEPLASKFQRVEEFRLYVKEFHRLIRSNTKR